MISLINLAVLYINSQHTLSNFRRGSFLRLPKANDFFRCILPLSLSKKSIFTLDDIQNFPEPLDQITIKYLSALGIDMPVDTLSKSQIKEIESHLKAIEIVKEAKLLLCKITYDKDGNRTTRFDLEPNLIITQPGMRCCIIKKLSDTVFYYADDFVCALNNNILARKCKRERFSIRLIHKLSNRVINNTKRKILEDIILLEAQYAIEALNKKLGRVKYEI